jgi:hypothetical protein
LFPDELRNGSWSKTLRDAGLPLALLALLPNEVDDPGMDNPHWTPDCNTYEARMMSA